MTAADLWFRRFDQRAGATWRLICLPHAGGNAEFFRSWAGALPPSAELLAVQYPGRLDRTGDPQPASLAALAQEIAAASAALSELPTVIFGHSLGAAIASEVTRLLDGQQRAPAGLVVSGREAPSRTQQAALALDDEALLAELRRLSGTDERVFAWPELLALVLATLRSDYQLEQGYRPAAGPPVRCPVLAAVGHSDSDVSPVDAGAWAEFTTGRFELLVLPGDHFYLVGQRDEVIAAILGWVTGVAGVSRTPAARTWPGRDGRPPAPAPGAP
jgi:pyochelin biosynthetic protein PchC